MDVKEALGIALKTVSEAYKAADTRIQNLLLEEFQSSEHKVSL